MLAPHIRDARPEEAALISDLGRRTFIEAFGDQNDAEHLQRFLDAAYREDLQARELSDPAYTTLLAYLETDPAGFAQLRRGPAEACVEGPSPIELQRIYVLAAHLGRGVGPALLEACARRARGEGYRTLWLGVWEHNPRAQAFYRRHGFRPTGSHVFDVGGDLQTDLIFVRDLEPS